MKSYKTHSHDNSPVNKETHFQDKLLQITNQNARQTCDFATELKKWNKF